MQGMVPNNCTLHNVVGFGFRPTDEELVDHYLKHKLQGDDHRVHVIPDIDLCRVEPWEVPVMLKDSVIRFNDPVWFFFSRVGFKYSKSKRANRTTKGGYWKITGTDRDVKKTDTNTVIGTKKTLVFYEGRVSNSVKSNWVIHEYHDATFAENKRTFVLCRLIKKTEKTDEGGTDSLICDEGEPSRGVDSDSANQATAEGILTDITFTGTGTTLQEVHLAENCFSPIQQSPLGIGPEEASFPNSPLCNAYFENENNGMHDDKFVVQTPIQTMHDDKFVVQTPIQTMHDDKFIAQTPIQTMYDDNFIVQTPIQTMYNDKLVVQTPIQTIHDDNFVMQSPIQTMHNDKFVVLTPIQTIHDDNFVMQSPIQTMHNEKFFVQTPIQTIHDDNFVMQSPILTMHDDNFVMQTPIQTMHNDKFVVQTPINLHIPIQTMQDDKIVMQTPFETTVEDEFLNSYIADQDSAIYEESMHSFVNSSTKPELLKRVYSESSDTNAEVISEKYIAQRPNNIEQYISDGDIMDTSTMCNDYHYSDGYHASKRLKSSHNVVHGDTYLLSSNHEASQDEYGSTFQVDFSGLETSSCDSTPNKPLEISCIEISSSPSTSRR